MPPDAAFGIHYNLIGYCCQIVEFLQILVAIGHHEFAALLERSKFIANLLKRSKRSVHRTSLQIYSFYIGVILCLLDGSYYILKPVRLHIVAHQRSKRVFIGTFGKCAVKVQHKDRILLDPFVAAPG